MNYIWEAVLQVKKNGICDWGLEYQQAEAPSPYMEVSFCDLNTASIEQNIIKVNPFYRFSAVFEKVLDINNKGYCKTKEIFLDTVMHYMSHMDLRMGMSKREYYCQMVERELEEGQLGERAKAALGLFSRHERKVIVSALLDLVRSGNHTAVFKRLFRELYTDSVIYEDMEIANMLFVYAGKGETEDEKERIHFLTDTFLPFGMRTEIFYAEHFGILDVEETMVLDRILLI